jgi:hypothetical protein
LMARRRVFVLNQTLTTTAINATATVAKLAHSPTYCQPTTALLLDVDSRHTARSAGHG